jgi:hypothetical protein
LAQLAITPATPIAAFIKRLRFSRCGSQSVRAKREVPMLLPIAGKKGKETAAKPVARPATQQKRAG